MCTCDLCFEEKYYFSSESLLYIAYALKWKERNKVNFCLLFDLFVFASFHSPVYSYIRVEN